MCVKSPRSTTPISRTSRLSATPSSPPWNSSSSLAIAECRPSTRAIPSPASVTRPISSRRVSGVYEATWRSIASRISSGRIASSVICSLLSPCRRLSVSCGPPAPPEPRPIPSYQSASSPRDASPRLGESVDDGRVDHLVAHRDQRAAQHGRIDLHLQLHLGTVESAKRRGEPGRLPGGERTGDPDDGEQPVAPLGGELGELGEPVVEQSPARGGDGALEQGQRHRPDPVGQQVAQERDLPLGGQARVGEGGPQVQVRG